VCKNLEKACDPLFGERREESRETNKGKEMSFGVDFGQKVDLTASIRNILRNYPEGTSILKVDPHLPWLV
jgi:hypothetical protein